MQAFAGMGVQPFELQQSIQRFTGEFIEGLAEAGDAIRDDAPHTEQAVLRRLLRYSSSVLDIASGPHPVVNLLDMLVFLRLSRQTLELDSSDRLGDDGERLTVVFDRSERHLWELSNEVISDEQRQELAALIECWRSRHAEQVRVEWVRFDDFAELAVEERARASHSLFGSFKSAAQSADQALLFAERAMFLANRLPFLIRLQTRLGVQESLDDSLSRLAAAQLGGTAIVRVLRRGFGYLIVLGLAWSALFWGGYALVK